MKETRPFSMKDKIGYTLGDLGCCCTEQFRAMYLAIFYTLVLKVNPVHVGILMLVTKFWDAINDPLIGALVDSHKNKGKGKFIPWIKFFAFPTAVLCILGFVNVSNFAYGARIAYMFITYIVYEIMYTCVNVPFGSLSSVMTDDVNQRTDLSRFRSLGGTIFMTVIVIAGPLFLYKDNQPVPSHFLIMSAICAVIGLICLMFTSHWCKERIITEPVVEKKESTREEPPDGIEIFEGRCASGGNRPEALFRARVRPSRNLSATEDCRAGRFYERREAESAGGLFGGSAESGWCRRFSARCRSCRRSGRDGKTFCRFGRRCGICWRR